MWKYVKSLEYPVNIKKKDIRMAKYLVTQYGGANGELAAAWRYLNQRYTMPDDKGKAILLISLELDEILNLSEGDIALVCYEKPGDFCHRHLVSSWLPYEITEYIYENN